ncbi:DNA helicase [Mycobacterium phage JacoRen57]|nr:DNA helicase [Mycobacterium phage JacoRen57]
MKYKFKTTPYKHQKQAIRKIIETGGRAALLMEPRTGKTKVTIDYLSILASAGKIDRAVIVAPARVLDVWIEQFHEHCPVRYNIILWDKEARKYPLPRVSSVYQLTVLLVNYEAFGTPGRKLRSGRRSKTTGRFANRAAITKWLDGQPAAGVLDESHKIKSPSGRASTMVVSMRPLFKYRLILTGTPVTKAKRTFDIYMQWKFLNPDRFAEWPTVDEFKNHFGRWTHRNGFPQFLRPRNTAQLNELLVEDSFIVKREDCLDLPPQMPPVFRHVTLSERTADVYDTLAEEMVATLLEGEEEHLIEASIPLVLTLRLTQITGGFTKSVDGETVQIGGEKLAVLDEIFDEAVENEDKLVVAARFRSELDAIQTLAERKGLPVFPIRGGLTRSESSENVRAFRETEGAAVVVMNPQAGGVGIDLSTADHMIWYSLPTSWVDYTQACDRIALSKTSRTYTYILAKHTVDEFLYDTLQTDGDVAKALLKNPKVVLRK